MLPFSRRILIPACIVGFFLFSLYYLRSERFAISNIAKPPPASNPYKSSTGHPIDHLRAQAEIDYQELLSKQTTTDDAAAKAYESRRGRRPPPGFDKWLQFARDKNALIIEDFFDRIYDDLAPFFAVDPQQLRRYAANHNMRVDVKGGEAHVISYYDAPWMPLWGDLIGTVSQHLPNLVVPINDMDEPRVFAPWETINANMAVQAKKRKIVPKKDMVTQYSTTDVNDGVDPYANLDHEVWHHEGPIWKYQHAACSPQSPAAKYTADYDYRKPLPASNGFPEHSYQGYVSNWTLTKSVCDNPNLQELHGTFIEPIQVDITSTLLPLFSGSKAPINNDILLPAAMYWSLDERFVPMGDDGQIAGGSWDFKHNQMIWRGASTGGRNTEENWTRFQRHRFVAFMNATTVALAEGNAEGRAVNFVLPDRKVWDLHAESFAPWIDDSADAGFGDILCYPQETDVNWHCTYNVEWLSSGHKMPLSEQLNYKYLPDIDGNSFSGRYRAFLLSSSLPIKTTVYDEWHDSRLVPWKHFVPMDNSFIDLYGIMEYFMGSRGYEGPGKAGVAAVGHDDIAREIALAGKTWAETVLRREDMQVYTFRLLLEWARLLDDNRDRLGWIPGTKA